MRRNSNTLLASAMALLSIAGWSAEPGGQETADAAAKASTGQPSIIGPVLVSRPTIAHPDLSREARVYVQFLVSAEGKPVEMAVMQRSALVSPPSPWPPSRAACLIQVPIVMAEGPNSRDSEAVRPPGSGQSHQLLSELRCVPDRLVCHRRLRA